MRVKELEKLWRRDVSAPIFLLLLLLLMMSQMRLELHAGGSFGSSE